MVVAISARKHYGSLHRIIIAAAIGVFFLVLLYMYQQLSVCALNSGPSGSYLNINSIENVHVLKEKFRGVQYWKKGVTQSVRTLYETAFARFQIHTVLLEDGKTVVDDWMFCDEADHINVLIEQESKDGTSPPTYIVFQQTKYAIQGETLAILGGLIEPGEDPGDAAKRELKEELGMESTHWESLGAYRVAVNRGGGTTHMFLARKTKLIFTTSNQNAGLFATGESEKQKRMELSREELLEGLLAGKFQEVKWTATIAVALLKMQEIEKK